VLPMLLVLLVLLYDCNAIRRRGEPRSYLSTA
jgi:hypothetical protein